MFYADANEERSLIHGNEFLKRIQKELNCHTRK